ncbi:hypothetical protein [Verrucomicrobium spinosum]|uniref:hypothetical protein n=1 Tax=Verrucomicrobium spinosum TaxID=2736 RepID=UPI000174552D|nr:hypothetical protein [Verrucomicrobium spinosum]
MISPVDSKSRMNRVDLEPGLVAYRCPVSGGHWLPYQNYWRWLSQQPARLPHLPPGEDRGYQLESEDSHKVKICPETGTLMTRYKVGHGFEFSVDRSAAGIWFDVNEWEALRSRNFHDEVHLIMTAPWQAKVRREALEQVIHEKQAAQQVSEKDSGPVQNEPCGLEAAFRARFAVLLGPEVMERAEEIKSWLDQQPARREILTYLLHDPS